MDSSEELALYSDEAYQLRILNECKRIAEICYIHLYAAGEDGEVLEYHDLLEKVKEDVASFPEDEKIELNLSEIQLMCLRTQEVFYADVQAHIEEMKRNGEL